MRQALTERDWFLKGYELVKGKAPRSMNEYTMRIFRQHFGCSPLVLYKCWGLLSEDATRINDESIVPTHLLWTLLFLKVYGRETTNANLCRVSDKTFRTFTWRVLYAIADLESEVVSHNSFLLEHKLYTFIYLFIFRWYGIGENLEIKERIALCPLTQQMFQSYHH
jgi:hypothetical protein